MLGLYLHIPFCKQKCHYCSFVITTRSGDDPQKEFLRALEAEIRMSPESVKKTLLDTVYLGGGTPSQLSSEALKELFGLLKTHFIWKSNAEVTLEANPSDIHRAKAQIFKSLGINRVSLGAQSFNLKTLQICGRDHTPEDIQKSFQLLKDAGISNISLDLILSLPGESLQEMLYSVEEAIRLKPEHLSLYELTLEKGTVFEHQYQHKKLNRPDEETELKALVETRERLKKAGYLHYELLSYALPGFESRHNTLYWHNESYLGLGPGAFSYIEGTRFSRATSHESYVQKMLSGDTRYETSETLSARARLRESFILALRLKEGILLTDYSEIQTEISPILKKLVSNDLVVLTSTRASLTEKGKLFAENVFSELAIV